MKHSQSERRQIHVTDDPSTQQTGGDAAHEAAPDRLGPPGAQPGVLVETWLCAGGNP